MLRINKISLALISLLPGLALANVDSAVPNWIHNTTIHVPTPPATVDYNVYVGYQMGPHCLIDTTEPVIHTVLSLTTMDTPRSIDANVLFKNVHNIGTYTCAEEVFTPYNSPGFYTVGFLLTGDTAGYHKTEPAAQYVTVSQVPAIGQE